MNGRRPEVRPLFFDRGELVLLDQRRLPGEVAFLRCATAEAVAEAIRALAVRGAPAIGLAAAYGVVLAARQADRLSLGGEGWFSAVRAAGELLIGTRPTAVNLSWAVRRMLAHAEAGADSRELLAVADAMAGDDVETNMHIGELGARLLPEPAVVLTHCNAGALATGGYGTALGVVRRAWRDGRLTKVFATETRPLLQGARLTAWELMREGIPVTLLADAAAPWLLAGGEVNAVVVGADRIAANGDVANKVGTYGLAVAAARHRVPLIVAAPLSTVDPGVRTGGSICIEERSPDEVTSVQGVRLAPAGVEAWNPAFDVTPAELVAALVTEVGVLRPPYTETIAAAIGAAGATSEEV